MSFSAGGAAFKLAFQLSPIILTNGIAANIPGGALPIIAITEALNFPVGILSGGENIELDDFFANFEPLPGASTVDNQIGNYPFANQAVAANAIIAQPLTISMQMICPARQAVGYATKLATMMALQAALTQHNASGGTYVIATPSFIYVDCIMTGMRDASQQQSKQAQNTWQLDFVKPLLTLEQAQQAQNSLMSKITNGTAINGQPTWSGLDNTVGQPPSLAATSVVPAATPLPGAGVAGTVGTPGAFGGP
jgi:hypothetical protein